MMSFQFSFFRSFSYFWSHQSSFLFLVVEWLLQSTFIMTIDRHRY